MKYKKIGFIISICLLLYSCDDKKKGIAESNRETLNKNNGYLKNAFDETDKNSSPIKLPLEYYKNIILQHSSSRGYVELLDIREIECFIPGCLSLMVYWRTGEGYVYKLYTFALADNQQAITEIYNLGNGWPSPYMKTLTEKIPGERFGDYLIVRDINDDKFNEIITFSFGGFGSLFTIYGVDITADTITKYCEIEYYFNYDEPFPPIEIENNRIRILEIIDKENYDLVWNGYIWNGLERKYTKQ